MGNRRSKCGLMDEMTDFLEHAGLGRFVEVFSHFGFGSVDDLLDPNLVMDDDLIEYCGMVSFVEWPSYLPARARLCCRNVSIRMR